MSYLSTGSKELGDSSADSVGSEVVADVPRIWDYLLTEALIYRKTIAAIAVLVPSPIFPSSALSNQRLYYNPGRPHC